MIGLGSIFDFLWFVLSWTKPGQRTGMLAVTDHVFTLRDPFPQKLWFGFLGWLLQRFGSDFFFSFFFFLFRAPTLAYGSSQARDRTKAAAAGLHHSSAQIQI